MTSARVLRHVLASDDDWSSLANRSHSDLDNPKKKPRRGPHCGAPTPMPVAAAIDRHLAAGLVQAALGLYVDDSAGDEAVFGRQRAGDQL